MPQGFYISFDSIIWRMNLNKHTLYVELEQSKSKVNKWKKKGRRKRKRIWKIKIKIKPNACFNSDILLLFWIVILAHLKLYRRHEHERILVSTHVLLFKFRRLTISPKFSSFLFFCIFFVFLIKRIDCLHHYFSIASSTLTPSVCVDAVDFLLISVRF